MKKASFITAISTCVPDHAYTTEFAAATVLDLVGDTPAPKKFIKRLYANTGIETRYSVIEDYRLPARKHLFYPKNKRLEPEPSTKKRNDFYIKHSKNSP